MDLAITQSMLKPQGNHGANLNYFNEKNQSSKKKSNTLGKTNQIGYGQNEIDDTNLDEEQKRQSDVKSLINTANSKLNLYVNNENIKKPDPVVVQIYLIFLRIGEIDNVKERFQADAYLEASWEDNSVDIKNGFTPHQNWDPELFIENAVGNLKQDIKYRVEKKDNKTRIVEMRTIKGVFWEKLELWDFPLDIQSLSITITSSRDKSEVKFEQSTDNESAINTKDFQQQQEWNLYSHIELSKRTIYDVWNNHNRPCFTISSTISRRPGYFIYNAYMLIFLISILGFVPFSFSYNSPHFRIQTTCLLILSSVNFRWIVTQKLPTVSYLTTLDKYAIGALVFLVSLCAWHAIIGSDVMSQLDKTLLKDIDTYALISIGGLYFVFHLIYIIYFIARFSRYSKIGKEKLNSDDEPEEAVNINSDVYFTEKQKNIEDPNRPTSISTIKPQVKSSVLKPGDSIDNNDTRYRNLVESASTSPSGDSNQFNAGSKEYQRINNFKDKTVNNPFIQANQRRTTLVEK